MCEVYDYAKRDGSGRRGHKTYYCRDSDGVKTCDETAYYEVPPPRPTDPVSIPGASRMPPSPRLTPGSSPRPGYSPRPSPRMDTPRASPRPSPRMDSPRTSHHDSDSETSGRYLRPHVYVHSSSPRREPSHRRHRSYETHPRGERIVIVENPPTPRTPPTRHAIPRTAPSSPSPAHESLRHQPVIVDERERPRVRISVPPSPALSSSSSGSRRSRRDDQRRRERAQERERERKEAEVESRVRRREARIAQANQNIAGRPEQPVPPKRASTYYARPRVEIPSAHGVGLGVGAEEEIVDGMFGMQIDDEEEEENEARNQRLRERMTPKESALPRRRATVGAGTRRVRHQYPDGMFRME